MYWQDHHFAKLNGLNDFAEMFALALNILDTIPSPITQICGPITTGALTLEENVLVFKQTITALAQQGHTVFNQMPFQNAMERICKKLEVQGYPMEILDEFYLPLFESGKIRILYFIPGWEQSTGARWEHEQGKRLGLTIKYLPTDWVENLKVLN